MLYAMFYIMLRVKDDAAQRTPIRPPASERKERRRESHATHAPCKRKSYACEAAYAKDVASHIRVHKRELR